MESIKKIIADKKPENISDFFLLYKAVETEKSKRNISAEKNIKVAVLSSFTITGIKEVLSVKCYSSGIAPEFYISPYNQYAQEILDKNSGLYGFNPDLTILFIDTMSLFGEVFFNPYRVSEAKRREILDEKYEELVRLTKALSANCDGKIIVHNLEVPAYSSLGILENKQDFGFLEMIRVLNSKLMDAFRHDKQVFIFDYDLFCSKHGKKRIFDSKMYYLGDMKLALEFFPQICEEYMGFIKPMMSIARKCVILDLDNTLWGGVVGEDGIEGIRLGPDSAGKPFFEFQKHILNLLDRGVILAINSRNNQDDVFKVLREHPYMVLREDSFASIKINWQDKIDNIREIADEINIGLDSMIYIDDDKLNRQMVKKEMPEICVIDLPEDPALYVSILTEINELNTLQITSEDKERSRAYADNRKRQKLQSDTRNVTDYLRELDMAVTIEKANDFTIPRIAQLTQKTNQFNMTTKRYMEEDIKGLAGNSKYLIFSARVEDRFGDNGIVGVIIIEMLADQWRIDTFLLSCRVLGREIEKTLLAFIIDRMGKTGCLKLTGEFISTKKNEPAKDFYKANKFTLVSPEGAGIQKWELDLKEHAIVLPDFIKVSADI